MTWSLDIVLLMALAVTALWAVMATRLIYAALGLAFASIALAVVMFRMGSPYAAVIELSVCAGLITAIFISVISLAKHETVAEIESRMKRRWKKYAPLPLVAAAVGVALSLVAKHPRSMPQPLAETDVRKVFWHMRQADLIGQIIIVLVGAFGIVVLFKSWRKK
ncbi:MAG TPA: NADH-quinone oxidoreductase subunit J [bacterium]|nr:NADH-quinone oxidoreductase subunit J [bacterium]